MVVVVLLVVMVFGVCLQVSNVLVCIKEFKEKGCNKIVSELFNVEMFEVMFKYCNDKVVYVQGFWSYDGFIVVVKMFEKDGFGMVGGEDVQKWEFLVFFVYVVYEILCKFE